MNFSYFSNSKALTGIKTSTINKHKFNGGILNIYVYMREKETMRTTVVSYN